MLYFSKYKVLLTIFVIAISCFIAITSNYYSLGIVKGIKLGLDLKGGSYLVLEPDKSVLKDDFNKQLSDNINQALSDGNIAYSGMYKQNDKFFVTLNSAVDFKKFKNNLLSLDKNITVDSNNNTVIVSNKNKEISLKTLEILQQSIEVIRRRVDAFGTNEPVIKIAGDGIVVELPGVNNPAQIKEIIGKTARISFNMVDEGATLQGLPLPIGYKYANSDKSDARYAVAIEDILTGDHLKKAFLSFDQQNQPVVSFTFDQYGAKKFADVTSNNVGKMMAIVLDGKVISAPRINSPIVGGSGIIEGRFSMEEAQDLALLLQAGSLPVPLKVTEERTVGPTLGEDSIKSGFYSSVVGALLVFVFMAVFYRKLGMLANISLIINAILTFASLSLVGATLTLPGIAGIILGTGMAVDSNILVYERYNYEIKYAKPHIAMSNSFQRVYQTLLDSNLTTLFTALFLFYFGTGPVRGFAVTLIIGILTSMFSIFFTTRMLVNWFYLRKIQLKVNRSK
ncbi:protein translocase subunit SecD [Rickettsiales bacterium LUAb2]